MFSGSSIAHARLPFQIYQAVEEAKGINQDLLRKYKREMQLRKKCHNELVRLRGEWDNVCGESFDPTLRGGAPDPKSAA